MNILILFFAILFFILAWRRLDLAVMLLIAALPAYLIRFNILGLPSTLLEVMIWAVFIVWAIANWTRIKSNITECFKKDNKKIKIHYPFDWELILLLLVSFVAAGVAGFSASSLGIWKAYFLEPVMLFIVVINIIKNPPLSPLVRGGNINHPRPPLLKGAEIVLWPLAVSALAVSALAIYQKITGQLIGNPLWAAENTRRVVSFFGYPNAVGLYLGPIVLVMLGWLASVIARRPVLGATWQSLVKFRVREIASLPSVARNDIIKIILIGLIIVLSLLSIYFAKSKGALLGVAVGLIVFALMAGKKIRCTTIIALIVISLGVAVYQPARDLVIKNITLTNLSGQIRKAGWNDTWKMLKDGRLLTGVGLANYQAAIAPYHTPGIFIKDFSDPDAQRKLVFNEVYRTAHWQPLEIYLYPHNIILNFWSELGLAGLLLFVWVIIKYFFTGIKNYELKITRLAEDGESRRANYKFLNIGLICAMVVIIVHGLVDVPYFKNDLAVMFWLLVAMMSLINFYGENNI